ncbi:MAG: SPBc2 prophage-derived aminoglycoside N(3')-acetyltransferase-like protein YokD [Lentisphaerae bacterium ADurb.Bin242]|nr:MAG: SPBc2 prophage-derived aminoglycoside N(3')-acetyltransferase-like protein YokD [Lentisphaerae bacterium ADurb.Bin242]
MAIPKTSLVQDLYRIGVCEGDVLLVHSSLRAVGAAEGGADTVLDALLEAVGDSGTLLMPGFQSGSEYVLASQGVCFDAAETPSGCGFLTELFRKRPGTIRSLSPTHSLTGQGTKAEVILSGHERCNVTAGWGSPFQRIPELDGKILMLGATRHSNTMMHYLENTGGAPTLCAIQFKTSVVDTAGRKTETLIYPHMPGLHRNYPHAIDLLEKAGGLTRGKIGEAVSELYSGRLLEKVVREALRKNPCEFIQIFTPGPEPEG